MFLYRDEYYNDQSEDQGLAEVHPRQAPQRADRTEKLAFLKRFAKFSDLAPHTRRRTEGRTEIGRSSGSRPVPAHSRRRARPASSTGGRRSAIVQRHVARGSRRRVRDLLARPSRSRQAHHPHTGRCGLACAWAPALAWRRETRRDRCRRVSLPWPWLRFGSVQARRRSTIHRASPSGTRSATSRWA